MAFKLDALPYRPFSNYFGMSERDLKDASARTLTVPAKPGYPCVVSLADADAELGERVLLANFTHLPQNTPYRASHAIYVREGAVQASLGAGEVPEMLASRLLAIRGYDDAHMMVFADVIDGARLAAELDGTFADAAVRCIHIHVAKPGCFAARATRPEDS